MRFIILILALLVAIETNAQEKKELSVGAELPVIPMIKIIPENSFKLNSITINNKLLILDFWSTSCSSCIAAFPKLDSLQKQFSEKIKILPITEEKETYVNDFWKSNKYTRNLKLSSVVEDTVFKNYFKHRGVPHEVWIYKGKVIAITDAQYVSSENIQKILKGDPISWPVKNDFNNYPVETPLFTLDDSQIDTNNTSFQYAAISASLAKENSPYLSSQGFVRSRSGRSIRSYMINTSILDAYITCLFNIQKEELVRPSRILSPNQIIWDVADRSRYQYDKNYGYRQDWLKENAICFESYTADKGQSDQQLYQEILANLDGLFGLKVRWVKRNENVLILKKTSGNTLRNQNKTLGTPYWLSSVVYNLNQVANNPYVFMEENSVQDKLVRLNGISWKNISGLNTELKKHGYTLEEVNRDVDKLIFSEIDGGLIIDYKLQKRFQELKQEQVKLPDPTAEEGINFLKRNKSVSGVAILPSGLQYKVIKSGSGSKPNLKSRVRINYTGRLINGKVFESTDQYGRPIEIGVQDVIPGWTEALQMMSEGSKWIIYVPAELAYGNHTNRGTFQPNSTLIFDIELLKIVL